MRIYLLGMMGAGKTTLGRELAGLLQYPFFDLDEVIVQREGRNIPELFREKGEDYFRLAEAAALRELSERQDIAVIATGGGTPCFHENMAFIKAKGLSIWLDVPVEVLEKRLQDQEAEKRPLLTGLKKDAIGIHLAATLAARTQFYSQADIRINTDITPAEVVLERIKQYTATA